MNKKVVLILVIVAIVLVGAIILFMKKDSNKAGQEQLDQTAMQKQEGSMMDKAMNSALEKLRSGERMQCTYIVEVEDGSVATSTVAVEGEKFKYKMTIGGVVQNVFYDGSTTYSWNNQTNTGTKMSKECMESLQGEIDEEEMEDNLANEFYESSEQFITDFPEIKCESSKDADLSMPKGLEFTDQCVQIKEQQELFKQMEEGTLDMEKYMEGMEAAVPQM